MLRSSHRWGIGCSQAPVGPAGWGKGRGVGGDGEGLFYWFLALIRTVHNM